jgi:hypothetical protein
MFEMAMQKALEMTLESTRMPAQKARAKRYQQKLKNAGAGPAGLGKPRRKVNRITSRRRPTGRPEGGVRRRLEQQKARQRQVARVEITEMFKAKNQEGFHQRPVDLGSYNTELLVELHLFAEIREKVTTTGESLFLPRRAGKGGKATNLGSGRFISRGKALLSMHNKVAKTYPKPADALARWDKVFHRKQKRKAGAAGPSSAAGK